MCRTSHRSAVPHDMTLTIACHSFVIFIIIVTLRTHFHVLAASGLSDSERPAVDETLDFMASVVDRGPCVDKINLKLLLRALSYLPMAVLMILEITTYANS